MSCDVSWLVVVLADSFQPGEGHAEASRWMGGPHDGMGPEYMAELSRNAPKSGSNHKHIVVGMLLLLLLLLICAFAV